MFGNRKKGVLKQEGTFQNRKRTFQNRKRCSKTGMPCPFTGPKMFCAGPNILSQSKNLTAFSASSKNFVLAQKPILLNSNQLGPARNILGPVCKRTRHKGNASFFGLYLFSKERHLTLCKMMEKYVKGFYLHPMNATIFQTTKFQILRSNCTYLVKIPESV